MSNSSSEVLRGLAGEDRYRSFTDALARVAAASERMQLQVLHLVHEYALQTPFGLRRFVAAEIALLLGVSERSAEFLLQDAELLMAHPAVLARVADGVWTLKHARTCLSALAGAGLGAALQEQVLDLVLGQGARTPHEVGKATQAAIVAVDPEAAARRHERAVADRGVSLHAFAGGKGTFTADGSVSAVAAMMAALETQVGPALPGETRSRQQRLFDALMDLLCGRVVPGQWQACVVMSLDTLTGASDAPAEIPGLGLISALEARELAAQADLRRVVVDSRGELVEVDGAVARPSAAPAATPTLVAEDKATFQVEDPAWRHTGADADVSAQDLAWFQAQLDAAPTQAEVSAEGAGFEAALQDLLTQAALTELVLAGAVPAAHVAFETEGYQHHEGGGQGPPGPNGPGAAPPDRDPPGGGSPPGGGRPPTPFTPPARPGLPARPEQQGPQEPEPVPPSPGDLAWIEDTTDPWSDSHRWPPPRYRKEPGTRAGGAALPTPVHWTAAGLHKALSTMLRTQLNSDPLASRSYALPTRMARHVKTRDLTCTFPGCSKLAKACQSDHVIPWPQGRTCKNNIASECLHHQSKTARFRHQEPGRSALDNPRRAHLHPPTAPPAPRLVGRAG